MSGYRRFAGCYSRPVITGNPGCSSLITSLIMWLWLSLLTLARCPLSTPLPPLAMTLAP